MLVGLLVSVVFLVCSCKGASFCDTGTGWTQVFVDHFAGDSINASNWNIATGCNNSYGRDSCLESYNLAVGGGVLTITTKTDQVGAFKYSSGAVDSSNKKSYLYGRACISAKLPGGGGKGAGQGIWPAHWMMPNDKSCWPDHGEVDIMEMINGDSVCHGTYHWSSNYPARPCVYTDASVSSQTQDTQFDTKFHEYATEWGADYVNFYLDGVVYKKINKTADPQTFFPPSPMYIILNSAIGGPWPKPPTSSTILPTYHIIDYVAVSQPNQLLSDPSFVEQQEEARMQVDSTWLEEQRMRAWDSKMSRFSP